MADENQATLPGTGPDTLTLDTLESHLWAAADKLRGSIDSADYKNYIFGLLFLKRVNDRFEEETEEVAEEYGIPVDTARDDRDLHSDVFWNAVGALVPDYEDQREWLRIHGNSLCL